jgi:hypothetical protein
MVKIKNDKEGPRIQDQSYKIKWRDRNEGSVFSPVIRRICKIAALPFVGPFAQQVSRRATAAVETAAAANSSVPRALREGLQFSSQVSFFACSIQLSPFATAAGCVVRYNLGMFKTILIG